MKCKMLSKCCVGKVINESAYCLLLINKLILFVCTNAGLWTRKNIKNIDLIRMNVACEIMDVDPRDSIHYMVAKVLGVDPRSKSLHK